MVYGKHKLASKEMKAGKAGMKQPKSGMKASLKEEATESPEVETKEIMKGEHLEHPQVARELGQHLTNDMAHFLHHPQLAPEHSQWKATSPKGDGKKK